ncbi:MAG TPA: S8 family serine peptidase [Streptosporangiaceae bacterium]|nr:S8 family serine peptidase [Streptosporangiaceae bacterium]
MHGSIQPARLTRSRPAQLPAAALLLSGVLVAGCTGGSGSPAKHVPSSSAPFSSVSGCLLPPASSCYAPRQFRVAYGIQPVLDHGIDGRGETVTVLAPPPPRNALAAPPNVPAASSSGAAAAPSSGQPPTTDIRKDLAAFDSMFRLPAARIQVVTTLAGSASPWQASGEEVQDLEVVDMVAPAATLRVVLLPSNVLDSAANATADMIAALRLAVSGTDVASIGWSLGEHFFTKAQVAQMHSILRGAAAHHVTVAASSGDNGSVSDSYGGTPVKEVSLPASDPLVLAVGGTTLTANRLTGAYISETTWNGGTGSFSATGGASGGGFSHLYTRPAYQDGVPGISTRRGVPDVAGDADQQGGIPIVFADVSQSGISSASGTSASTALWAGLMALADQDAHHGLGFVNHAIYRIARSASYHKAFHDITTGNNLTLGPVNYRYHAGPGWDTVTGWGSPNAQVLVPLLART